MHFPQHLSTSALTLLTPTTSAAGEYVDSAYGNAPALDCNNVFKAWDLCAEHGCSGQWEEAGRLPRDCIPGEPRVPCPGGGRRPYLCRKVAGGYDGWGMRNALLGAYLKNDQPHCWFDARYLAIGARGTYEWVAIRSTQHGGWINIVFKVSDVRCEELK
ncbi:hypothetical protein QBC34DRAFT_427951 [Podospora aff. communis PSN243]|uniref:Uncharacterized protein n=1 Tax=Podospora aff. communis PSN243 TaxID=3040156 RepID=A0AAV9GEZ1_9PEZI|nr:hypothetical protein QBC34DRAFT_427951 [Podospora aff. communis PSN243]